jgi:hypothetical protein
MKPKQPAMLNDEHEKTTTIETIASGASLGKVDGTRNRENDAEHNRGNPGKRVDRGDVCGAAGSAWAVQRDASGQAMPMRLEAWPGGRWYRNLGGNNGHYWGTVQAIKKAALPEICGPLFRSNPVITNLQYRLKESGV